MFKIFKKVFALRCTTKTNMLIHAIRQIPLIKYILPGDLYGADGFKVMAYILVLLWEVIMTFLIKLLALGGAVMLPLLLLSELGVPKDVLFLHIILCMTLFGGFSNTHLFSGDLNTEVAVTLLRMDAKDYTLANYFYYLLRLTVGYLPLILIFGLLLHIPVWILLLLPFGFSGTKLLFGGIEIAMNNRFGYTFSEKGSNKITLPLTVLMLAAAYALPVFGYAVPIYVSAAILIAMIPPGLLCFQKITSFGGYKGVTVRLIANAKEMVENAKNAQQNRIRTTIDTDTTAVSSKKGFEYLNDLFIKRHRKILWSATVKITIAAAVLLVIVIGAVIRLPALRSDVNGWIMSWLSILPLTLYAINRGTGFTQALFMNCDHCLLTYPFFKKPKSILALFRIRLREIMKINAVPAAVIGVGLTLLLAITGGTENPINYAVVLLSPIALSMFFSVHYLTLYYLLQPYTAGSEMKNAFYKIISGVTYAVCYSLMRIPLPTLAFGIVCIVFCVAYSIVACMLVYQFAAKTFKLRT